MDRNRQTQGEPNGRATHENASKAPERQLNIALQDIVLQS
jgi:hypothetical protein